MAKKTKSKKNSIDKRVFFIIAGVIIVAMAFTFFMMRPEVSSLDENSPTLVEVNGQHVTEGDLQLSRKLLETQTGQQVSDEVALEHAVVQELMIQEAEDRGYSVSKKEAEEQLSDFTASKGLNLEEEKKKLESQGQDYDELLEGYRNQILIGYIIEEEVNPGQPTQEEIEVFYESNKQNFKTPEGETVSYTLLEPQIREALVQQDARAQYIEFVQSLKSEAEIVYLTDSHVGESYPELSS